MACGGLFGCAALSGENVQGAELDQGAGDHRHLAAVRLRGGKAGVLFVSA
jgi:hypothetical protein